MSTPAARQAARSGDDDEVPVWAADRSPPTGSDVVQGPRPPTGVRHAGGVGQDAEPGQGTEAAQDTETVFEARPAARPRSGFVVALLLFFALQCANALVVWREAPIRSDAMIEAVLVHLGCAALVVPALLLRGRWRALPLVVATIAGAVAPVGLSRDLIGVLGPRDVWVGQSLTLHVLFPLVLGAVATVAVLSAPRPRSLPAAPPV
ncbi:MAG: hypothetical protein ACK5O2_05510 [Microthrixaceae bacterium]